MALSGNGKLVTLVPAAVVLMLLCAGAVQATCTYGQKYCSGSCVQPQTDANNCGSCGVKCIAANAYSSCYMSSCKYECKAGFKNCDGKWENGCECEPGKDVENCGRCGAKCKAPANAWAKCKNGECKYECKPGHENCDGSWANGCECYPETDPKNCGTCGNKCKGGCTKGKCEEACKKGQKYNQSKKRCEKDGDDDEGKHGDDDGEKGKGGYDDGEKGKGGQDDGEKGKHGDDDGEKGKHGDDDGEKGKGGHDDGEKGKGGHDDGEKGKGGHDDGEKGKGGHDDGEKGKGGHDDGEKGKGGHDDSEKGKGGDDGKKGKPCCDGHY